MKPAVSSRAGWAAPALLGTFLMLAGVVSFLNRPDASRGHGDRPASCASTFHLTSSGGAQPWGKLTAQRFPLCDGEVNAAVLERFVDAPRWFFGGATEQQLLRYFRSLDLGSRERQNLLDRRRWSVTAEGIVVKPAESVVYALDAFTRGRIYAALRRHAANELQHCPLVLPQANLDAQFAAIGLTLPQIARVKKLTYVNAGRLCLADLGVVRKLLGEDAFGRLVEFLFATPAYRLRLVVSAASDIDALAQYWGRGGREAVIRPMLKSLARVPGGSDVPVSALLPDFARVRLYHYPSKLRDGPSAERQDCIYSSLNFFNATPDAALLDDSHVREVLERDYEPVTDRPAFGDLMLVRRADGEIIHMCVYVADEFLFTKNGMGTEEPWTLMRADDVLNIYCPDRAAAQVNLLRMKQFSPPQSAPPPAPPPRSQTSPSQT